MTPNTADFRIPPFFRQSRDRRYWGGGLYAPSGLVRGWYGSALHFTKPVYSRDGSAELAFIERVLRTLSILYYKDNLQTRLRHKEEVIQLNSFACVRFATKLHGPILFDKIRNDCI